MRAEQIEKMRSFVNAAKRMRMICRKVKNCKGCPFYAITEWCGIDGTPEFWYIPEQKKDDGT